MELYVYAAKVILNCCSGNTDVRFMFRNHLRASVYVQSQYCLSSSQTHIMKTDEGKHQKEHFCGYILPTVII